MDTKTILRRQLMKRKMTSNDGPLCAGPVPYAPELYGVPPNKMLIRSTSELPYPSGTYHIPLQHSSSFSEGTLHPHLLYRGISGEESYLAQFHHPTKTPHGYLFEGGYPTLTPNRKHSFTFHPSQRSPALHSNESVSPINGHATQHNQNNNAQKATIHHEDPYYASSYSSRVDKSPRQDALYYQSNGSPPHMMSSPASPVQQHSPVQQSNLTHSSVHRQVDNVYQERECVQTAAASMCGNPASSPIHAPVQPQCSVPSYGSPQSTISYPATSKLSSVHPEVTIQSCGNLPSSPSYANEWNEPSYAQGSVHPSNLSAHQLKEEALSPPECNVINSHCASPQTLTHPASPYNQGNVSPALSSPNAYPTSSCSQVMPETQGYGLQLTEKPYHVQYSISSGHPQTMQQYQAAALYAANQSGNMIEGGMDWTKKYRNMPNMVRITFNSFNILEKRISKF